MTPRGVLVHAVCLSCGQPFTARQADRNRGWAKCCGKACAARLRERRGLPAPRALGKVAPSPSLHYPLDTDVAMSTAGPEFDFSEDHARGDV